MKFRKNPGLFVSVCVVFPAWLTLSADTVVLSDPLSAETEAVLSEADGARQTGESAPLEFQLDSGETDGAVAPDQARVTEDGLVIDNEEATFVSVSPDGDLSKEGGDSFRVRVEIAPEPASTSYSGDRWAQVHFGGKGPNQFVAADGFGILVRSDASREDGYQVFHNGEYLASGSVAKAESYRFDIVVEDGEVAFTINGKLQVPFDGGETHPVGDLRLGYVTLGVHNPVTGPMRAAFTDLSLSRLEVTSASALILSSLPAGSALEL